MGHYDISRVNTNPKQHYTSVRMQQGRVLTDDDWNEKERIEGELDRRSLLDIIGPSGSPDNGFKIDNVVVTGTQIDFDILPGRLYLGGLAFDLEAKETYRLQKDFLQLPATSDPTPQFDVERYDLVYLEGWQQPVCAVEDSALFEVALGGPDTTIRVRNMRRVHMDSVLGKCSCSEAWEALRQKWQTDKLGHFDQGYEQMVDALLKVTYTNEGELEDLCTPHAAGGYLGAENQAIRVQLTKPDHLTWGFDNASPLYKVQAKEKKTDAAGNTTQRIHFVTQPKDQYHWPLSNQVVEIIPWSAVLSNGEKVAELSGQWTKVETSYDPDSADITIIGSLPAGFGEEWKNRTDKNDLDDQDPAEYFYLRVWNRGTDLLSDAEIKFMPGTALPIGNTGLAVTLTGTEFVINDFWVIAARPETPDQVVPWALEIGNGISPHGVRRFFTPLAIIKWTLDANHRPVGKVVSDCRRHFNTLTAEDCCCTFTVGDGKTSFGDYNSIQEAVDNLPSNGGKVCVLPGEHLTNTIVANRRQVRISGCGDRSIVAPAKEDQAVFTILQSQKIQIDSMTITHFKGIGVLVADPARVESKMLSEQITIRDNNILAGITAIHVELDRPRRGDDFIEILYNKIGMIDIDNDFPAIFSKANGVLIERNRIVVIAANRDDPGDPGEPADPGGGDPFDPCAKPDIIYRRGFSNRYKYFTLIRYISVYLPTGFFKIGYKTNGGIQIGSGSERVRILENDIIGGKGNGITFGHLRTIQETDGPILREMSANIPQQPYGFLYEIIAESNRIFQMGLSGISILLPLEFPRFTVFVDDLLVCRNLIRFCCQQISLRELEAGDGWAAYGGIVLQYCENGRFEQNRIEENGLREALPICGIFIYYGEFINIAMNIIVQNGLPQLSNDRVLRGNRGGIVLRYLYKTPDTKKVYARSFPSFDGVPSAKIHDNIVLQPLGHALYAMVHGPVSVVDNQFTSMGTDRTNPLSVIASTVLLMNMGLSPDMLAALGIVELLQQNDAKFNEAVLKKNPSYIKLLQLPSGKTMFASNQSTLDMRAPERNISISSQLILSFDDIAFNTNQSDCNGMFTFANKQIISDVTLLNTVLLGASVRSNDNRFTEGITMALYSLLSVGFLMATATGNHSSHCLIVGAPRRIEKDNLVLNDDLCRAGRKIFPNIIKHQ